MPQSRLASELRRAALYSATNRQNAGEADLDPARTGDARPTSTSARQTAADVAARSASAAPARPTRRGPGCAERCRDTGHSAAAQAGAVRSDAAAAVAGLCRDQPDLPALHRDRDPAVRRQRVQGARASEHPAGRSDHGSGDGDARRKCCAACRSSSRWPTSSASTTIRSSTQRCDRHRSWRRRSRRQAAWPGPSSRGSPPRLMRRPTTCWARRWSRNAMRRCSRCRLRYRDHPLKASHVLQVSFTAGNPVMAAAAVNDGDGRLREGARWRRKHRAVDRATANG